jgi:hypothetical protein
MFRDVRWLVWLREAGRRRRFSAGQVSMMLLRALAQIQAGGEMGKLRHFQPSRIVSEAASAAFSSFIGAWNPGLPVLH